MTDLVKRLKQQFPNLKFKTAADFSWSSQNNCINYKCGMKTPQDDWYLLHEVGHALLGHKNYGPDIELLKMEVAAWHQAEQVAKDFGIVIDYDHIQDCLDTYRQWLNKRSLCPACGVKNLQQGDFVHYRCYNCHKVWQVSENRFSRSYRKTKNSAGAELLFA